MHLNAGALRQKQKSKLEEEEEAAAEQQKKPDIFPACTAASEGK